MFSNKRRVITCQLALCVALISLRGACELAEAQTITAERALEWDALFDRTSGWTGADGIYSIPLDGIDALGSADEQTRTLFVFSDTAIGGVGPDGQRLPGTTLVNNTLALLQGALPSSEQTAFWWGGRGSGEPRAVFVPDTPDAQPGEWYWLMDGLAQDGRLFLFALRMREGSGGVFNFAVSGVALIQIALDDELPVEVEQRDTPLFFQPSDGRGEIIFGAGIMSNTAASGAPHPDGYLYVYGTQNDPFIKKLVVARVLPAELEDFTAWSYWDGEGWSSEISDASPLTSRVSSELSVTPLADGRYVVVFQVDAIGTQVGLRLGDSPVGPFGPVVSVWQCPEVQLDPDIFVYNAKAHPHLSDPGELLISYNVNTFDFWGDFFDYADIYRPRFIRVMLTPSH